MEPISEIIKRLPPRQLSPETEAEETLKQAIKTKNVEYQRGKIFGDLYRLYADCSIADFPNLSKKVTKWLESGRGIYIYGGVGLGKTHLALSCLKWHLDRGEEGWIWGVDQLLDNFRYLISTNDGEAIANLIKHWCTIPFLVLDDLGAQKSTVWADEKLYEIINGRWLGRDRLITVVTSNYSPLQLEEKARDDIVGERIVSRIVGMCELLELKGEDRRLQRKKK